MATGEIALSAIGAQLKSVLLSESDTNVLTDAQLAAFVRGAYRVQYLPSDQDSTLDTSQIGNTGTWRTGSSWSATRTITLTNTPASYLYLRFSNNSGQTINLANGSGSPVDWPVGFDPFPLKNGETLLLERYSSTAKLIKTEHGQEQSSSRWPPFGGGTFTFLTKNSSSDHDFAWHDLDDFTEDTTPDISADELLTFDVSAGEHRKVLLTTLIQRILYYGDVHTATDTSGAVTIDLSVGSDFRTELSGDVTYTFSNPATSGRARVFLLEVVQDSTARTITWPDSVVWPGGVEPTLSTGSGSVDEFVFRTRDGGTTWTGSTRGQDFS